MIKPLFDKQIFASSDARFCRNNDGRYIHNFSLDMVTLVCVYEA